MLPPELHDTFSVFKKKKKKKEMSRQLTKFICERICMSCPQKIRSCQSRILVCVAGDVWYLQLQLPLPLPACQWLQQRRCRGLRTLRLCFDWSTLGLTGMDWEWAVCSSSLSHGELSPSCPHLLGFSCHKAKALCLQTPCSMSSSSSHLSVCWNRKRRFQCCR